MEFSHGRPGLNRTIVFGAAGRKPGHWINDSPGDDAAVVQSTNEEETS